MRRHVSAVSGIQNVPEAGPMILIANHESYFDVFAICVLFRELFGRRVWVPTKVKAFKGPLRQLFHEAGNAVAVDQANPADAYRKIGDLLERGECVLVFPEGKRSEGAGLLPFQYGGFNMAVKYGAPVVPIALHGTKRVLPKGRLTFVRNEKASIEIGARMDPHAYTAPGDASPDIAAGRMRDSTRQWIEHRLAAGEPHSQGETGPDARSLAAVMERRVERLLENGIESIPRRDALAVRKGCELAFGIGIRCLALEVQYTRAFGFCILGLPRLIAFLFLRTYVRLVQRGLSQQANNPYLHYCMGQYHSRVPALLGGSRTAAVTSLAQAYEWAAAFGIDAAKFVVTYASSLARVGRNADAMALLLRHFASKPGPTATGRELRRYERARALATRLRGPSTNVPGLTV
jgi:1-acyl-sn-glycerol-3-phosphate acyltransferase